MESSSKTSDSIANNRHRDILIKMFSQQCPYLTCDLESFQMLVKSVGVAFKGSHEAMYNHLGLGVDQSLNDKGKPRKEADKLYFKKLTSKN